MLAQGHTRLVVFELKALTDMRSPKPVLIFLLALLLAGSSIVFSAHAASHSAYDSGLCSLCVHSGGGDSVIATESGALFVEGPASVLRPLPAVFHCPRFNPHFHQSRAPPSLF